MTTSINVKGKFKDIIRTNIKMGLKKIEILIYF